MIEKGPNMMAFGIFLNLAILVFNVAILTNNPTFAIAIAALAGINGTVAASMILQVCAMHLHPGTGKPFPGAHR